VPLSLTWFPPLQRQVCAGRVLQGFRWPDEGINWAIGAVKLVVSAPLGTRSQAPSMGGDCTSPRRIRISWLWSATNRT